MSNPDLHAQYQSAYSQYQSALEIARIREKQISQIQDIISESRSVLTTVQGLQEKSDLRKAILPLSNTVTIEANLEETARVLIDIGSGVIVPYNFEDAEKYLSKKIEEHRELLKQMDEEMNKLQQTISGMQNRLNQLQST